MADAADDWDLRLGDLLDDRFVAEGEEVLPDRRPGMRTSQRRSELACLIRAAMLSAALSP